MYSPTYASLAHELATDVSRTEASTPIGIKQKSTFELVIK